MFVIDAIDLTVAIAIPSLSLLTTKGESPARPCAIPGKRNLLSFCHFDRNKRKFLYLVISTKGAARVEKSQNKKISLSVAFGSEIYLPFSVSGNLRQGSALRVRAATLEMTVIVEISNFKPFKPRDGLKK